MSAGVKFIYSEKAANFCEISTVDLSYVVTVKFTVEISQNFVACSEYMNFTSLYDPWTILFLLSTSMLFQCNGREKKNWIQFLTPDFAISTKWNQRKSILKSAV